MCLVDTLRWNTKFIWIMNLCNNWGSEWANNETLLMYMWYVHTNLYILHIYISITQYIHIHKYIYIYAFGLHVINYIERERNARRKTTNIPHKAYTRKAYRITPESNKNNPSASSIRHLNTPTKHPHKPVYGTQEYYITNHICIIHVDRYSIGWYCFFLSIQNKTNDKRYEI